MVNLSIKFKIVTTSIILSVLTGCSAVGHGIAMLRSTEHFSISQNDGRIYFEEGSEDITNKIESYLNNAISVVETNQHLKFNQKIKILICATSDSFSRLTSSGKIIPAKAFNGKVFLSAKWLREEPERIQFILAHELSHLQYMQSLGLFDYMRNIPGWFREGIAEYSSEKGTSDIDDHIAIKHLIIGNHFIPTEDGDIFFPFSVSTFLTTKDFFIKVALPDMKSKMQLLYKQSHLFIRFFDKYDSAQFKKILVSISKGVKFKDAFRDAYKISLIEIWTLFIQSKKSV